MEDKITSIALCSRIIIIILQYLSNILIPDHEADAFLYPPTQDSSSVPDKVIHHFLGGFVRWDAQYFMHIMIYGYTFEKTLAFFPLYPITVKTIALLINCFLPIINLESSLLLVSVGLNVFLFILSARLLFKICTEFFDEITSYNSVLFFCFNPASIFFSAPYSECMFYYLTLQSILNCLLLYKKFRDPKVTVSYLDVTYLFPICLSAITRSNGILNIGFLVYTYICLCMRHWPNTVIQKIFFILIRLCIICILVLFCVLLFFLYQIYCYNMFCKNFSTDLPLQITTLAEIDGHVLPGQFLKHNQSWCYEKIPLAYSYVQSHYWNVGFLKYYELIQIPNFLLAAPVFVILISQSITYAKKNIPKTFQHLFTLDKIYTRRKSTQIINNSILNVFVIHILFLVLFCALFVHIQVSTRMFCSASPILYWFCAGFFKNGEINKLNFFCNKMYWEQYALVTYFLSYFVIGTILFCNFLPWT